MKDAIERIMNKGKSVLLSQLADKVESTQSVCNPVASGPAVSSGDNVVPMSIAPNPMPLRQPQSSGINVVPVTVINKPMEYENELVVKEDEDIYDANSTTERIVVKNGVSNHPDIYEWDLSECERLVELVVGNDCLQYLEGWKMSGLKCLEKMEFGSGCMCKSEGGAFEVSECEKLKSVVVGGGCCVNWSSFTLKNCEVIEVSIGDGCFVNCESVMFEGE